MLERLGGLLISLFAWVGDVFLFGVRALYEAVLPPYEIKETWRHVYEIGWRSLPLVVLAGLAIGVVLSMHTRASMERFGAEAMIPMVLAIALIRETGPLVAGLLVAGRVGAGIGAEIGAMKVTDQIDALEAVAVDAFKFLAVTRILACIIAMPLLTAIIDFCGIFGGYLAEASASGMSLQLYFHRAFSIVQFRDFVPATLKTAVFGFVIGTVASYLGFTTTQGTEGVGRTSTSSVVLSSICIILINVVLVKLIFLFFPVQA